MQVDKRGNVQVLVIAVDGLQETSRYYVLLPDSKLLSVLHTFLQDLYPAELYQVTTGNLNKAVKRNLKRFPPDFMFQLTEEEWKALRFQIGIIKKGRGEHTKYFPYAFTEQGLAMLSGLLNSDIAIHVNINIMRAFVAVHQMIALPPTDKLAELQSEMAELKNYVEEILSDQNDINEETAMQLELINQSLAELQMKREREEKPRNPIGFIKPKT